MPEYKLIYFNTRGRAELARWCFAYGGIPYNDDRIERDNWAERKKEMPGGQVPVLMVDGKPLPESLAITRYVAKQAGLVPKDDLEAAGCDAIVDALSGIMVEVAQKIVYSKAEPAEKQRIMKEEILPNKINPFLNRLNERLSTREWFISDKTTWADLIIALVFSSLTPKVPDVLKDYPAVSKLVEKVQSLDSIKKWLNTRPVTDN
ncbi:unnamed protein product [Meganyctiphanes norvegica]|uniref:glutathione transferase n=1 Tax=Meganyctiphanes norvegica TaxID=48144 RepID=A0AAV2S5S9_MEGNR